MADALRVLLVDDSPEDRCLIRHRLEQSAAWRCRVVEAETTQRGLELCREEAPDVVLLDVALPGAMGSDVVAEWIDDHGLLPFPVVGLASSACDARAQAALQAGVHDSLDKSAASAETLARAIRNARERFRLARELHGSEQRFALLADAIPDRAVVCLDRHGVVSSWNRSAEGVFGYAVSEVVGNHFSILFTPEERADGFPWIELARARNKSRSRNDCWLVRKDGSRFQASIVTTRARNSLSRLGHFVMIVHDRTEQSALEDQIRRQSERLAENDRCKEEFLAMLAHELRNPLASILSAVQLIDRQRSADPSVQRAAGVTRRQVEHVKRILDDLLDLSRITRGKIQLRREPGLVQELIARAIETAESSLAGRGHDLSVVLPKEDVWLEADQARMEQVLVNLLSNSAKYTAPGGRIEIAAAVEDGDLVIRVSDNGRGIAPELLPRVFDMFCQDERPLDRSQGGLGIGLTLVKSLVELHDGKVSAQSEGEGCGAEFTIRMPLASKNLPQAAKPSDTAAQRPVREPHRRRRVLLVEDNVDAAEMLAALLKLEGFETAVAHDGLTALDAAEWHHPDAILIDIGLPGIDGYEVARRLRAREDFDRVTLVAVTGYGQDEDRRRAASAGFDQHLVKPVTLDAILPWLDRRPETCTA